MIGSLFIGGENAVTRLLRKAASGSEHRVKTVSNWDIILITLKGCTYLVSLTDGGDSRRPLGALDTASLL